MSFHILYKLLKTHFSAALFSTHTSTIISPSPLSRCKRSPPSQLTQEVMDDNDEGLISSGGEEDDTIRSGDENERTIKKKKTRGARAGITSKKYKGEKHIKFLLIRIGHTGYGE